VVLSDRNGGIGPNYDRVTFDDDGVFAINNPLLSAPYKGVFIPQNPLSVLNSKSPNGTWTLMVEDLVGGTAGLGNIGTLIDWSLSIDTGLVLNNITNSADVSFDRDILTSSFQPFTVVRVVGPTGVLYDRVVARDSDPLRRAQNVIQGFTITPLIGGVLHP